MKNTASLIAAMLFVILLGATAAEAQVNINFSVFPALEPIPHYPVYYAPRARANYFFYDGLYWVFNVDAGYWYSSSWYNGPWVYVEPVFVPQPVLIIPYRYYRVRPAYWSGWAFDAPPRWGQHWGGEWEIRRRGWDHWDRSHRYVIAPLPLYQKDYPRGRYPSFSQQVVIHNEHYHYKVQDALIREHHDEIVHKQSQGGVRANGKAARAAGLSERREKSQGQGRPAEHQAKSARQEKVQEKSPQHQEKTLRQEKGQHQEKEPHQGKSPRQEK